MSKLAENWGVRDGQESEAEGRRYQVLDGKLLHYCPNKKRWVSVGGPLARMFGGVTIYPVEPLPPTYSPETIEALRCIATLWPEWPWIACWP